MLNAASAMSRLVVSLRLFVSWGGFRFALIRKTVSDRN